MERRNYGIADDVYAAGLLLASLAFIPFADPGSIDAPSLQRCAHPFNALHALHRCFDQDDISSHIALIVGQCLSRWWRCSCYLSTGFGGQRVLVSFLS